MLDAEDLAPPAPPAYDRAALGQQLAAVGAELTVLEQRLDAARQRRTRADAGSATGVLEGPAPSSVGRRVLLELGKEQEELTAIVEDLRLVAAAEVRHTLTDAEQQVLLLRAILDAAVARLEAHAAPAPPALALVPDPDRAPSVATSSSRRSAASGHPAAGSPTRPTLRAVAGDPSRTG